MKHQHGLKPIYVCVLIALAAEPAAANPYGAAVINGQASFVTVGNTLTVTNTPGAILNWQSFSISSNEITRFAQQSASSAVLNRVISNNPSSILGSLFSNGRVFLVNPNGIVFGAGSTINVAGLVATTLNLSNANFLAGRNNFTRVPGAQNISNAGNLAAQNGGQIFLIAPNVENTGMVTAPNGEILLAAGHSVELVNSKDPSLRVKITAPAGDATNIGKLVASAGKLGLFGTVVRNSGTINANSAVMQGGKIVFKASQRVEVGGTVNANGLSGGSVTLSAAHSADPNAPGVVVHTGSIQASATSGAGGAVSLSGDSILSTAILNVDGATAGGLINVQATNRALSTASAQYSANSTQGSGGDILVSANVSNYTSSSYSATGTTGGKLTLAGNEIKLAGAQLDASGTNGGGNIHVGGLMHGAAGFGAQGHALTVATNVLTNSLTRFKADALQTGNGGQVVLWSDQAMRFKGSISAKGGALGGNGGMAEISGLTSLGYGGLTNLSAANGLSGTLLLDPRNITIVPGAGALISVPSPGVLELIDPTPGAGEGFGSMMTELVNGNIVIASPYDNFAGTSAGAVYMYLLTGTLQSTLTGSAAYDQVGSQGVVALSNGNYVVRSGEWAGGGNLDAGMGAVTWGSGTVGVSGVVSSGNSLVGSNAYDRVGKGIVDPWTNDPGLVALPNGNYVVVSSQWSGGKGAVTWGDGGTGTFGVVAGVAGTGNALSLVGAGAAGYDGVGAQGINVQTGGSNYVVQSPWFDLTNTLIDSGAATWMNGTTGMLSNGLFGGVISAANSLLGGVAYDNAGGVTALSNGNFVASTPVWSGGNPSFSKGAATWINGLTGALMGGATGGTISSANSLVGVASGDYVGWKIVALPSNGNYVVSGSSAGTPTATWVNGTNGQTANATNTISAANSLMGASNAYTLTNGNYVVVNGYYAGGGSQRGVATWVNGTNGLTSDSSNVISATNSIIGSTNNDMVGQNGVVALPNGNYVLQNFGWSSNTGAVTWVSGATGQTSNASNVISQSNSVVGNSTGEQVGARVVVLTNGNYVIGSYNWRGPEAGYRTSTGAATWVDGVTGLTANGLGQISQNNSLLGFDTSDMVGYNITALSNGNYVVGSPFWSGNKGAVTWGNGLGGTITSAVGFVSTINSLVGSLASDYVGASSYMGGNSISALSNGNFVFGSAYWNSHAGAVTWGNGATAGPRTVGAISSANSILGAPGQYLGYAATLSNGNYVVSNASWNGYRGAVTWVNGGNGQVSDYAANGNTNIVSAANSLVGSTAFDSVGSGGLAELGNGNYAVSSYLWNNGAATAAGAVTWADSLGVTVGAVSAANSLLGDLINENLGYVMAALKQGDNTGNVYVGSNLALAGAGRAFILGAPTVTTATGTTFSDTPATDVTIGADNIAATLNTDTNVVLQANNDITQQAGAAIVATGLGNLTMQAGRSVMLNDAINIAGALNITANDAGANPLYRLAGVPVLNASAATLTAGLMNFSNSGGDILLNAITAGNAVISDALGSTILSGINSFTSLDVRSGGASGAGAFELAGGSVNMMGMLSADMFTLSGGTWNQVALELPAFAVNDFRIVGGTFIRALGGDGSTNSPYQLADIYGVQGIGSSGMLGNAYVLANDIDASGTVNWNTGAGFAPIGINYPAPFYGQLDGQGFVVSSLTINRPDESYVGLFGYSDGALSNIGLMNATVVGGYYMGGLVGENSSLGTINNSYIDVGSVTGSGYYQDRIGGLVGNNGGTILDSHASNVSVSGGTSVGGLAGYNRGTISNSYVSGGSVSGGRNVGGLVGHNMGGINGNSHVDDFNGLLSVSGSYNVGGLVGANGTTSDGSSSGGAISGSYVSGGTVGGYSNVGGLVGYNYATTSGGSIVGGIISSSFVNTGTVVTGASAVGGLVGENNGTINDSNADNMTVIGTSNVGGLVGHNSFASISAGLCLSRGCINNSHVSSGSVFGGTTSSGNMVGGLVGANDGYVSNSYVDSGSVTGAWNLGGLIGYDSGQGVVDNSHYNINSVTIQGANQATRFGLFNDVLNNYERFQYDDWRFNGLALNIADYSSLLVAAGVNSYTISDMHGMKDLLGFSDLAGYTYTLANDINLDAGYYIPDLAANFDGAGFTVSGLNVNQPFNGRMGLFGTVANGGAVSNVNLLNPVVSGNGDVGGLSGWNGGIIANSHVIGGTVTGADYNVGGLVGYNRGGISNNSFVSGGAVIGNWNVGGLVGYDSGDGAGVADSHVIGSVVSGSSNVGGLVGQNNGSINNSYVSGGTVVSGSSSSAGGLAGSNYGSIVNSYVDGGSVSGSWDVGGLVGYNNGSISSSYVSGGSVMGTGHVGGLVGHNDGDISNSYVSGVTVSATGTTGTYSGTGGLVGYNFGSISNSYVSGGSVSGNGSVGGLVGTNEYGAVNNSFWDSALVGIAVTNGINYDYYVDGTSDAGAAPLSLGEMKTMASFTGWDIANTGGAGKIWRLYEGSTTPLLTSFLTPLTITGDAVSAIYNNTTYSGGLVNPMYSPSPDMTHVFDVNGNPYANANAYLNAVNAGTYAPALYSDQQGYDLSFVNGMLTINPVVVTLSSLGITAKNSSKTYGSTLAFSGTEFSPVGLIGGDTISGVTLSSLGAVNTANAGTYAITPSAAVFSVGNASNYIISYVDGQLTVSAAPLTVTAHAAQSKIYGDPDPALTYATSGLLFNDTLTGKLSRAAGENVGAYPINQGTLGLLSTNYTMHYVAADFGIVAKPLMMQDMLFSLTNLPGNNLNSDMPFVTMSDVDLAFKLNPSAAGEEKKDDQGNAVLETLASTEESITGNDSSSLPVCRAP